MINLKGAQKLEMPDIDAGALQINIDISLPDDFLDSIEKYGTGISIFG
jgi:hypothetical protein